MRSAALALVALALGCTKQGFLKPPEAGDDVTGKVGSFQTDTHFLLEPSADAEDLLGRAVHLTSNGGWTIADARAPGCSVRVKRSRAEYEKSYNIGLGDLTAMSGGYSDLLRLEARYGRSVEATMRIQNTETLTADVEGSCGEVIVKSVRVGTGERRLQRKAEGSVKGRAGKGPVAVEGGREGLTDVADEIKWTTPQAYAFSYEQTAGRKVFEIDVSVPTAVTDGDILDLQLTSDSVAYVIVYYLDQNGGGAVIFPDDRLPAPRVKPDEPLVLPPKDHDALAARLSDPKTPARDTLVVYAFADRGDFDRLKPAAFGDGNDAVTYAARLTEALSKVPISRWDRHTVTIEIQPKSE